MSEQREELLQLLKKHLNCITKDMAELGSTHLVEMDIVMKPNAVPISMKSYRANKDERETIKTIVRN